MSTTKMDIIGSLPPEISFKILISLTPEDVANSLQCCKKWREVMNCEGFWKRLYRKVYFDHEEEPTSKFYRKHLQSYSLHWQGRYMYNRKLEFNFRNNIFKTMTTEPLKLNAEGLIHFDNRFLIFLNYNRDGATVIDSSTGLVLRVISFSYCCAFIKHKDFLIGAKSMYMHVRIWNIENGKCVTDAIMGSQLENCYYNRLNVCKNLVLISGHFRTTKIGIVNSFNMETRKFRYVGEYTHVSCSDETIAMAHPNGSIELFDTNLDCLMKFDCLKANKLLHAVLINNDFVVTTFSREKRDCFASVWNINTKASYKIALREKQHPVVKMLSKNRLLCVTDSKSYELWDLHNENCLVKVVTTSYLGLLVVSDRYVVIHYGRYPIEVYSLTTGKLVRNMNLPACTSIHALTNSKMLKRKYNVEWDIMDYETDESEIDKCLNDSVVFDY